MTTITHKNREFIIVDKQSITSYPNIAAANPNLEFTFIASGKRGATISGYITKKGNAIVF